MSKQGKPSNDRRRARRAASARVAERRCMYRLFEFMAWERWAS